MSKNNKKGFTIIEVVLVLAIAGLIFLMVFIALPALQKSQRNTQRGNDVSRFLTAVNDYQTNNRNKTPFLNKGEKLGVFTQKYIDSTCKTDNDATVTKDSCGDQFTDPDGTQYEWATPVEATSADGNGGKDANLTSKFADATDFNHKLYVVTNAGCGSYEGTYDYYAGDNYFALFYIEEGGSITCNDNH